MAGPKHSSPDPVILEALTTKAGWKRVQRPIPSDDECQPCGHTTSTQEISPDRQAEALLKDYKFRNFKEAFAWMTGVAAKAEELKHHPEWSNVYNRVSVSLTTHSTGSTLTSLDLELAQACDDAERNILKARPARKMANQT